MIGAQMYAGSPGSLKCTLGHMHTGNLSMDNWYKTLTDVYEMTIFLKQNRGYDFYRKVD